MILPRNDQFFSYCNQCGWYELCGKAPFKAQRVARTHAKRNKRHKTSVLNVTRLEIVVSHYYVPLEVVSEPPF
jgi:hypothetical protein